MLWTLFEERTPMDMARRGVKFGMRLRGAYTVGQSTHASDMTAGTHVDTVEHD